MKYFFFIFLYGLLSILAIPTWSDVETSTYRLLFIASYNSSFPTYYDQIDGIKEGLEGFYYIMDVEAFDSKRFVGEGNYQTFKDRLEYKLNHNLPYDGILTADDNALHFVIDNYEQMFDKIPVVFFGVNNIDFALEQNTNPKITGFVESVSMKDTLSFMSGVPKWGDSIVIITDDTTSGQGDLRTYRNMSNEFPENLISVLNISEYTYDELGELLKGNPENLSYLLLSAYRDKNGNFMTFPESLAFLVNNSHSPIYHLWYHGLGKGIVGGKLISHKDQGMRAARVMKQLLQNPEMEIPIVENNSHNAFYFDYRQLKKFQISNGDLPPDSKIINEPINYLKEYGRIILIVVLVILSQSLTIMFLIINVRRLNNANKEIKVREEKFKGLFEHSPMSLWEVNLSKIKKQLDIKKTIANIDCYDFSIIDVNTTSLAVLKAENKDLLIEGFISWLKKDKSNTWLKIIETLHQDNYQVTEEFYCQTFSDDWRWLNIKISTVPGSIDTWDRIFLSFEDITDKVTVLDELRKALADKEVLLREVHHRVKNNLSIVTSLFSLQKDSIQNVTDLEMLIHGSQTMIMSMAFVHELIMDSDDLQSLDIKKFLLQLTSFIVETTNNNTGNIHFEILVSDNITLELDSLIPFGLIVNEIIGWLLKGSYKENIPINININLHITDDKRFLEVKEFDIIPPKELTGQSSTILGYNLINLLALQLKGQMKINSDNGFTAQLKF